MVNQNPNKMNPLKNAVVMACDLNYSPYAFFLAKQIASSHPNRNFDICIFSQEEIALPEGLHDIGINLEIIRGQNPFGNAPLLGNVNVAAYLRLLIPPRVVGRYDRILYLDCDIFLCDTGIEQLFNADMLSASIAAVRDVFQWRTPGKQVKEFKLHGLPSSPYFNSGVMLIDVARYQADGVLEQCLRTISTLHPDALHLYDQSLLNLVMRRRWTELSPVWNWQYARASRFFADLAKPVLVHFIGPIKPWRDVDNNLPTRYRKAYVKFSKRYYPGRNDIAPIDENAIGWPDSLISMFLKHIIGASPTKRYLNRFRHHLDTHGTR